MSASLCLIAWNDAICRPNAKRPTAYSRAMSSAAWRAADLLEGDEHGRAVEQALDEGPAGTGRAERLRRRVRRRRGGRDERVGSTVVSGVRLTPAPVRSTRNRPVRPPGIARPRATAKSATSPSITGSLVPVSRPPSARVVRLPAVAACGALGEGEAADGVSLARCGAASASSGPRCPRAGAPRRRDRSWRKKASARGSVPAPRRSRRARGSRSPRPRALRGWPCRSSPSRPCPARARRRRARRLRGCGAPGRTRPARRETSAPGPGAIFWSGEKSKFTARGSYGIRARGASRTPVSASWSELAAGHSAAHALERLVRSEKKRRPWWAAARLRGLRSGCATSQRAGRHQAEAQEEKGSRLGEPCLRSRSW